MKKKMNSKKVVRRKKRKTGLLNDIADIFLNLLGKVLQYGLVFIAMIAILIGVLVGSEVEVKVKYNVKESVAEKFEEGWARNTRTIASIAKSIFAF